MSVQVEVGSDYLKLRDAPASGLGISPNTVTILPEILACARELKRLESVTSPYGSRQSVVGTIDLVDAKLELGDVMAWDDFDAPPIAPPSIGTIQTVRGSTNHAAYVRALQFGDNIGKRMEGLIVGQDIHLIVRQLEIGEPAIRSAPLIPEHFDNVTRTSASFYQAMRLLIGVDIDRTTTPIEAIYETMAHLRCLSYYRGNLGSDRFMRYA